MNSTFASPTSGVPLAVTAGSSSVDPSGLTLRNGFSTTGASSTALATDNGNTATAAAATKNLFNFIIKQSPFLKLIYTLII